jgi:hypothetical protein
MNFLIKKEKNRGKLLVINYHKFAQEVLRVAAALVHIWRLEA